MVDHFVHYYDFYSNIKKKQGLLLTWQRKKNTPNNGCHYGSYTHLLYTVNVYKCFFVFTIEGMEKIPYYILSLKTKLLLMRFRSA